MGHFFLLSLVWFLSNRGLLFTMLKESCIPWSWTTCSHQDVLFYLLFFRYVSYFTLEHVFINVKCKSYHDHLSSPSYQHAPVNLTETPSDYLHPLLAALVHNLNLFLSSTLFPSFLFATSSSFSFLVHVPCVVLSQTKLSFIVHISHISDINYSPGFYLRWLEFLCLCFISIFIGQDDSKCSIGVFLFVSFLDISLINKVIYDSKYRTLCKQSL